MSKSTSTSPPHRSRKKAKTDFSFLDYLPSWLFGSQEEDLDDSASSKDLNQKDLELDTFIVPFILPSLPVASPSLKFATSSTNRFIVTETPLPTPSPSTLLFQNLSNNTPSKPEFTSYRTPNRSLNGTPSSFSRSGSISQYSSTSSRRGNPLSLIRHKQIQKRQGGIHKIMKHYVPLYEEATSRGFTSTKEDYEDVVSYMQKMRDFQGGSNDKLCMVFVMIVGRYTTQDDIPPKLKRITITPKAPIIKEAVKDTSAEWIRDLRQRIEYSLKKYYWINKVRLELLILNLRRFWRHCMINFCRTRRQEKMLS